MNGIDPVQDACHEMMYIIITEKRADYSEIIDIEIHLKCSDLQEKAYSNPIGN